MAQEYYLYNPEKCHVGKPFENEFEFKAQRIEIPALHTTKEPLSDEAIIYIKKTYSFLQVSEKQIGWSEEELKGTKNPFDAVYEKPVEKRGFSVDIKADDVDKIVKKVKEKIALEPVKKEAVEVPEKVAEEEKETTLFCDVCGKEAKSVFGLQAHKRSHK